VKIADIAQPQVPSRQATINEGDPLMSTTVPSKADSPMSSIRWSTPGRLRPG